MPDHRRRLTVAERRDEPERVAHRVQKAERVQIVVVIGAPPGGATVPAQIGGDDVISGGGQRPHDPAPGIGELGETVQQQQAGTAGLAGFENMDAQPVDALDKARANAGAENRSVERLQFGHWHLL